MAEIIACRATPDYNLWLRFSDGVEGTVFLGHLLDIGAFKFWRDVDAFLEARPDWQTGAVVWPAGVRLDPQVLYQDVVAKGGKRKLSGIDHLFERFMARVMQPAQRKRKNRGNGA